jgi:hypothetical protein
MSRSSFKDWKRAVTAPFAKRWGMTGDDTAYDNVASNSYTYRAATATDNEDIPVWGTDSDNALLLGGEAVTPLRGSETFYILTPSGTPNQTIMLAMFPLQITSIQCEFATANGAALTAQVLKDSGVQAPAAGSTVMSSTFNLNATANTVQSATLADYFSPALPASTSTTNPSRDKILLAAGDRLSLKFSTAITSLAGLAITVYYIPGAKGHVQYYRKTASVANEGFFLANRPMTVRGVSAIWGTAGSVSNATLDITAESSTTAPAGGTTILAAAFNVNTAANTVVSPALTATAANRTIAAGSRLSIKLTNASTALANVIIAVWFQPIAQRKEVTYRAPGSASVATQPFFVADIDYEMLDYSFVASAAGTGGACTLDIMIESGTTAPGSGVTIGTGTLDLTGTANTVVVGTLAGPRNRILPAGGRLSAKLTGTPTSVANLQVTVSMRARG